MNKTFLFELIFFYFAPFLGTVCLPVFLVFYFLRKRYRQIRLNTFAPFFVSVLSLVILFNIGWDQFIYNHVYYEWDRLFFPFSLLFFENPVLDQSSSWLAKGWTQQELFLLWFFLIILLYFIAAIIQILVRKETLTNRELRKFFFMLLGILLLISLLFGIFNGLGVIIGMLFAASFSIFGPLFIFR